MGRASAWSESTAFEVPFVVVIGGWDASGSSAWAADDDEVGELSLLLTDSVQTFLELSPLLSATAFPLTPLLGATTVSSRWTKQKTRLDYKATARKAYLSLDQMRNIADRLVGWGSCSWSGRPLILLHHLSHRLVVSLHLFARIFDFGYNFGNKILQFVDWMFDTGAFILFQFFIGQRFGQIFLLELKNSESLFKTTDSFVQFTVRSESNSQKMIRLGNESIVWIKHRFTQFQTFGEQINCIVKVLPFETYLGQLLQCFSMVNVSFFRGAFGVCGTSKIKNLPSNFKIRNIWIFSNLNRGWRFSLRCGWLRNVEWEWCRWARWLLIVAICDLVLRIVCFFISFGSSFIAVRRLFWFLFFSLTIVLNISFVVIVIIIRWVLKNKKSE